MYSRGRCETRLREIVGQAAVGLDLSSKQRPHLIPLCRHVKVDAGDAQVGVPVLHLAGLRAVRTQVVLDAIRGDDGCSPRLEGAKRAPVLRLRETPHCRTPAGNRNSCFGEDLEEVGVTRFEPATSTSRT